MLLNDNYANVPGMSTARETYENEFRWGNGNQAVYTNALIDGATLDSGNSPTFEVRAGLLLGQVTSTAKYKNYSPTATDGSEVATAILLEGLRMQSFENVNQDKLTIVLCGGPVQASKILNLDLQARQQMDKFSFDDVGQLVGNHWFPWKRFINKTANYSIVANDNFTMFDNTGATGEVDLTLPSLQNGYYFALRATAAQVFKFISNEASNIVGTSATNSTCSVTAIGGVIYIYSVQTQNNVKWQVEQHGTQTITFA